MRQVSDNRYPAYIQLLILAAIREDATEMQGVLSGLRELAFETEAKHGEGVDLEYNIAMTMGQVIGNLIEHCSDGESAESMLQGVLLGTDEDD